MTVIYVFHTFLMGGATLSMLQLILDLREKGLVEPIVVVPKRNNIRSKWTLYEELSKHKIKCYAYRYYWYEDTTWIAALIKNVLNFVLFPFIIHSLKHVKADMVHSASSVINLGAKISRKKMIPHIWHLREFGDKDFHYRYPFGQNCYKHLLQEAERYIAISKVIAVHYQKMIPSSKTRIVYNGVKPPSERFYAGHDGETLNICLVGRLMPAKNQMMAVKAVDLLVNQRGYTGFHLYLIGEGKEDYIKKLRNVIDDFKLNEYITLTGEKQNISQVLSNMDIGLMLSECEAFGRVTVEYMMHGLAVIASDTGANLELVKNGETGFIVKYNDIEALVDSIIELSNRNTLILISQKAQTYALNSFTSDRNTNEIYDVYKEVCN